MIRNVELSDAKAICDIYNYYIQNTTITFEENLITVEEMEKRIGKITTFSTWIVYEIDSKIIGYAYATEWKVRSAYRFSVETSVYLDKNFQGTGIGTKLYTYLLEKLKEAGKHSIIGGISLPNHKSVTLHERLGFRKIAHFKEVGYKHNKWIDVGYWQYNFKK